MERSYSAFAVVVWLAIVVAAIGGATLVMPPRGLLLDEDRVTGVELTAAGHVQLQIVRDGRNAVVTYAIPAMSRDHHSCSSHSSED